MRERRWPWWQLSALLLVAAVAAAWSTYLHWLPCRGTMLSGSVLRGYAYGPDFSDACLRRMNGGLTFPYPREPAERAPWAAELGVAATALAGLAWIVLVLGLRWARWTTAVAVLPGVTTLAVALVGGLALREGGRRPEDYLNGWLWLSVEATAAVALIAVWAWQPEFRGRHWWRLAIALWGATAFGAVHMGAEFFTMINFSDANWDTPPGMGYLTVTVLTISAVLTATFTSRIAGLQRVPQPAATS